MNAGIASSDSSVAPGNAVKVVFFDAAGTLLHLPKGVGWHYREVALRHGCDFPETVLNAAFGKAWKIAPAPEESRRARPDDDREWWKALVWRVLDLCGAPPSFDRAAYFNELYDAFTLPGVWELYPEAAGVLDALEPRFELGVISNFDGRLRKILQSLGVAERFRYWSISSEVGADKPSPWIYETALRMAGVAPGEALHVGDDPDGDWAAAERLGMHVFQLNRPHNSLRELLSHEAIAPTDRSL